MKSFRLLSTLLTTGLLAISACSDKDAGDTGPSTIGEEEVGNDDPTGSDSATSMGDSGSDTADTADTADATSTTGSFVPTTDIPVASTCDPFMQDCPDGEKCVAYASSGGTWDANKCVMVMGDGQPGDPCMYADAATSTDDCGAESWCWDVNMENVGTCTPFCSGSADAPICPPSSSCSIANEGSINLCLATCDPLLQDCPNAGTACFYDGTGFVCANAAGDIPTGEPCGFINDCVAGNICLAPESFPSCAGASCCGQFCDFTDPNAVCLPAGTECTAFYEEGMAPPGYETVGVCVLPA